jgi:predicted acylesterase/phospholipase RssA
VDLGEAVLASSAIPLLLPPRKIGGRYYVDGGVFNNTPLRDAILARAREIIVVSLKPKTKQRCLEEIEFSGVYQVGARLLELIGDKLMYEDMKRAKRVNEVLEIISALKEAGNNPRLVESLKKAIGYEQDGRVKREVRIYEIFPSRNLEPPGTLGFHHREAILEIMRLGAEDATRQLAGFFSQVRQTAS